MISEHWIGCRRRGDGGLEQGKKKTQWRSRDNQETETGANRQMVLRSEVVWVSNLRSHSGNGMEGVEGMSESGDALGLACLWVWYGLVWAGMGQSFPSLCPKSAAASTVLPHQSAAGILLRHAAAFTADRSARTHKEALRSAKPTPQRRFDTNSLLKRCRCTAQLPDCWEQANASEWADVIGRPRHLSLPLMGKCMVARRAPLAAFLPKGL